MVRFKGKYMVSAGIILLSARLVFGLPDIDAVQPLSLWQSADSTLSLDSLDPAATRPDPSRRERREAERRQKDDARKREIADRLPQEQRDSIFSSAIDSLVAAETDSVRVDTTSDGKKTKGESAGLTEKIEGTSADSIVFDMKSNIVYLYNKGDINYQDMNLNADFMKINMDSKEVFAYGKADSVDGKPTITHPTFKQGAASYTMDTINYNIKSQKAKIKGVATQEGDGWLIGGSVKKMNDNTIHIQDGKYTTCDHTDHPHFYLAMTKAKVIPGKKVITGPAYLVIEDVPIYFPMIPGGFFPISSGPKSGILMPTYGEEAVKGFFLRDAGYYFTIGEHMDLALRGGIYTLGSWEASAVSNYTKRYKFNGHLNARFSSVKIGDEGDPDYSKQNEFSFQWTHTQDPKANPGSQFSANVNLVSSGYSKYSATNINDFTQTQTNSSISYSKNWLGTPFSLSMNMQVSQVAQTSSLDITLPNIIFNVSTIYPFKRKEAIGKERWYEKISMSYTGRFSNSIRGKESEIFSSEIFDKMTNGIEHSIPVRASFNVLKYFNITPNFNYTEKWYFKRQEQQWNPSTNMVNYLDPEYGFYRLYNYNMGISMNTTIYGMYLSKKKTRKIQAVRHVITPEVSFSYAPNFGNLKYGYFKTVQTDTLGNFRTYSPYEGINSFGVPGSGQSMFLNFALKQNLEMKVLSKRDSSGIKKLKIIDELSISGSYNFLADSMGLSDIRVGFRSTLIKNFGINLNVTLDPYAVTPEGKRYNKIRLPGRVKSTSWSFNYSFKSRQDRSQPAINDLNSLPPEMYQNPFYDPYGQMDPVLRRQYMAQTYYDFSMPWNLSVGYSISYGITLGNYGPKGYRQNITQTVQLQGSVNLTPNTSINVIGSYDLMANKFASSSITITRDLHCWQMSFVWVPLGFHKSWSFNIGVKAASLADLKYDKSYSMYDNMY